VIKATRFTARAYREPREKNYFPRTRGRNSRERRSGARFLAARAKPTDGNCIARCVLFRARCGLLRGPFVFTRRSRRDSRADSSTAIWFVRTIRMFPSGIRGGIISANAISDVTSAWKKRERERERERERACRACQFSASQSDLTEIMTNDLCIFRIPSYLLSATANARNLSLSLSLSLPLWRKKIENFGHSSFVFILHEKETNVNVFGISNFFPR